ncbi:hypothetical protein ID875_00340 [Streptomyces globisporus]|uniref:Uncharacterized protein n=1 Tax=Streptomyces globisporus TaxID=1908 RepID=A0A927BGQ4_STRGL|nr:hypothetical protein [Streptomyces globisporus]
MRTVERGRPVVDVDEEQQALDLVALVEVDVDRLARGRAEPVVPAEPDVRRPVEVADEAAQRLDDPLGAVGQLVHAAEVQVDVDDALRVRLDHLGLEELEGVAQPAAPA